MSKIAERAATAPTKYVDVGNVRYAYRELRPDHPADKTPVLFLHRFRGTLDDWDPGFVDELAKTRHVILFSDQEIGTSTGTAATSVDEKARNAADFASALGHSTVDVLGFSMGGFICQAIAINEPKLVRKVVIIGSAAGAIPKRRRLRISCSTSPFTPNTRSRMSVISSSRKDATRKRRLTSTVAQVAFPVRSRR